MPIIETNPSLKSKKRIIKTKEELLELLRNYKKILNKNITDYIEELINLDSSVIKTVNDEEVKQLLNELSIFREAAIYNIYYHAIKIANETSPNIVPSTYDSKYEALNLLDYSRNSTNIPVFDFDYSETKVGTIKPNPEDYQSKKIGKISLYETIEKAEKDKQLSELISKLETLRNQENPYGMPSKNNTQANYWEMERNENLTDLEELIFNLESSYEITEDDKYEIELLQKFNEKLLKEYGITDADFIEKEKVIPDAIACFYTLKNKKPGIIIDKRKKLI